MTQKPEVKRCTVIVFAFPALLIAPLISQSFIGLICKHAPKTRIKTVLRGKRDNMLYDTMYYTGRLDSWVKDQSNLRFVLNIAGFI